MNYKSAKEAADAWGLTKRRVLTLCKEGRIPGAQLVDTMWVIPADAEKPEDGRSLRYQKERDQRMEIRPLKTSIEPRDTRRSTKCTSILRGVPTTSSDI